MSVHHLMRPDKLPGQLSFHPLDGAAPDANHCRHLEDAMPSAQMPPDGVLDLGRVANAILLRIISRSGSPKTDAIWIIARPIGVVLSIGCLSE